MIKLVGNLYAVSVIAVVEKADGIGWGSHDGITDALYEAFPPEWLIFSFASYISALHYRKTYYRNAGYYK